MSPREGEQYCYSREYIPADASLETEEAPLESALEAELAADEAEAPAAEVKLEAAEMRELMPGPPWSVMKLAPRLAEHAGI